METFTAPRPFTANPDFRAQRLTALEKLQEVSIDPPIASIVPSLSELPCCFTLQCCCGHFLHEGIQDPQNLLPLPESEVSGAIEYRIAYIAMCIENSKKGQALFAALQDVTSIDPEYIQLGSADWFWERQVNSYALQVEPVRFHTLDSITTGYEEARHIEKTCALFRKSLGKLIKTGI
jgi:hypothetical protein